MVFMEVEGHWHLLFQDTVSLFIFNQDTLADGS